MNHTEQLKALDDARWRIAIALTVAMMVLYFGFILLVAYAKPLLGRLVVPGLSLGHSPRRAGHHRGVGADLDLRAVGQHALRRGDRRASGANVTGVFFFIFIALSLGVTYVAARRTRSADHFYTAGGSVTGLQNGLALAGDYMSAASFLGIAGLVALSGFDGLIYSIGFLVGWPVVMFLIAEPLRNLGKYTFADVVAFRLRQAPVRVAAAIGSLAVVSFYLIAQMVGAGNLIRLLFGFEYEFAVVIVGVVMLAYVLFGGMMATTWVQIIKAVLLLSGAFLLAVMALSRFGFSPLALFRAASDQYGAAVLAPGRLVSNPFDAMSLGLALMLGTAGLPHILMRFYTVKDAKTARLSVSYATAFIGFFYLLTFILGFGAMVLVGQPAIRAIDAGGNMAAPLLAKAVGGDAFLGFISAVAFATILAVVAGLTLAGAATLSHDLWVNVVRHGVSSDREATEGGARVNGPARRAGDRAGDCLQRAERRVHGGAGVCDCREREFSGARAVDVLAQVHDARGADEHARRHGVEPDPDLFLADDSDWTC